MLKKNKILKRILLLGIITILLSSTVASSVSITKQSNINLINTNNTTDGKIIPPNPQNMGQETLEIKASYSGYVRKEDHTFSSDKYDKKVSESYILVGHNKKGNGVTTYDKHYKGFIEFDLKNLREIWDDIETILSVEIEFHTSPDDGDNFENVRTINLEIYDLDLKPSETKASKLYNDAFKENHYKTITVRQVHEKKTTPYRIDTIKQRITYHYDWIAIGLNCGTKIDEGKAGGVAIYSNTDYKPILRITYEQKETPADGNYALLIEGGLGDFLQKSFEKTIRIVKETFINKLGYREGKNLKVINFGKDGNTKSTIREAIVGWLAQHATKNSDCFVYMADHGSDGGKFYIGGDYDNPRYITPEDLDSWLDSVKCRYMTVMIEACYSGDFIGKLRQKNRIIITSTDGNKVTFSDDRDALPLFSMPFFEKLGQGVSYGTAWEYADSKVDNYRYLQDKVSYGMEFQVWLQQNPKIDDSDRCIYYGNFLMNRLPPDTLAKKVYPVKR